MLYLYQVEKAYNLKQKDNIMIKTRNMTSRRGNEVANQFIIRDTNKQGGLKALYFQSYDTIIVKVTNKHTYLDSFYWDYSATTGKYRNDFLNEGIADTRKKIKNGEYKLTNLN